MALARAWRWWLVLAAALAGWWAGGWAAEWTAPRGAVFGVPPDIVPVDRSLGLNVTPSTFGAPDIDAARRAGIGWLRVAPAAVARDALPTAAWLDSMHASGMRVLIALPIAPGAAPAGGAGGSYFLDWRAAGQNIRTLAAAYRGRIDAYQIGDEPNLSVGWGGAFPNPADYAALLREAAINIRAEDPGALIVTAALAPTTESGPLNLNEPEFLRQLYRAGARDFFDAVGAEPFGFWSGPDDRRIGADTLNFSRLVLLREVMAANGDETKPVWATSFGWYVTGEGASPFGGDSAERQTDRTLAAIQRGRDEWPWLGPLMLARWKPEGSNDARRGFALVSAAGESSPLWTALSAQGGQAMATVGRHAPDDRAAAYPATWRVTHDGADAPQNDPSPVRIAFRGTRFDLTVRRGLYEGDLFVTVDGQPANALPRDPQGRAYVVLYDPLGATADVTLARNLSDGEHTLEIVPQGGWGQWAIAGWVVMRERDNTWWQWGAALAAGLLAGLFVSPWALRLGARSWHMAGVTWHSAARVAQPAKGLVYAAVLAVGAALYLLPSAAAAWALIAALFLLTCVRLDAGLALVALAIPFYLQPKALGIGSYAVVEIALWVSAAAYLVRNIPNARMLSLARWRELAPTALDRVVVLWLLAGAVGVVVAENRGVATREFRVVFLDPALYYMLIRLSGVAVAPLVDAFLAGAALVAGKAVSDWITRTDLITAEGVLRARSVYFSPNNLALFLDRAAPVALALALFGRAGRARRIVYGGAFALLMAALYLTFARGAWLLAVPAALLLIGAVRGRRVLAYALVALVVLAIGMVPILGTARLQSLFDLSSGTSFIRLQLWQAALAMLRDHWLLGVGPDNFLYQYRTHYILPGAFAEAGLSHPHNIVLDFWTRLGVLGLILLAALLVGFSRTAWRAYRALPDGTARALALGWMAAMAAALAHGLIDNSFFLVDLAFVLMLGLAVVNERARKR